MRSGEAGSVIRTLQQLYFTFRVEEPGGGGRCPVPALVGVARYTLLPGTGHQLVVVGDGAHGSHRLDADDA